MAWLVSSDKIRIWVKQYWYILAMLLVGILFMLQPSGSKPEETDVYSEIKEDDSLVDEMRTILAQIQGVGEVEVLLTIKTGEEKIFQTNSSSNISDSATNSDEDTVMITDENRNEHGLVKQVIPPSFLGAIIVCQGADKPAVRWAVIDAVSKVTGLGADKISVLKMK